ncbi:hypothetical protein GUJ93_ZPchr0013g36202 [Zizania palustris]|uniref:Plastocyanin-like domain-containing protein n=1 Tax=Zizania palustris TaxID=103762 RepID=A0A8J6BVE3_ZIZPA|nr:hypothetical protein GUJ93_ZPchr0013g36202 [Zizania palustris]
MGAHCQALILLFGTWLALLPLASARRRDTTPSTCVKLQNVTRLCNTRAIPTVKGKFPGAKIVTREGDRVDVKVVNNIKDNITIHW